MKEKQKAFFMTAMSKSKIIFAMLFGCMLMSPSVSAQTAATSAKKVANTPAKKQVRTDRKEAVAALSWPPKLANGKEVATDKSQDFITKPEHVKLEEGVEIAKTAPTIDFLYLPGQKYPSKLWSVWGDGSATGTKYYTSIGDHAAPRGEGQVYEYDSKTKKVRMLMSI